MYKIGQINTLKVIELSPMGYLLASPEMNVEDVAEQTDKTVLLNTTEIELELGQNIDVFLYYARDRSVQASLKAPNIGLNEFKALNVVGMSPAGAFFDWGLSSDLYAPSQHVHSALEIGIPAVVRLMLDDKQQKLFATTKIEKFLSDAPQRMDISKPVSLLVYAKTPLGFKVIIDNQYAGLLYHSDLFKPVRIGESHSGFIKRVREDGKIDATLQKHNKAQRDSLTEQILEDLEAHGGLSTLTDKSPPDEIQARFNVSKASYKRALGQLYKAKQILITPTHVKRLDKSK